MRKEFPPGSNVVHGENANMSWENVDAGLFYPAHAVYDIGMYYRDYASVLLVSIGVRRFCTFRLGDIVEFACLADQMPLLPIQRC